VEVEGDRPDDPGEHDAIETQPRGGLDRDRGVDEDVVVEGVAAEGEEDQVPPTGVGGRVRLEDDRDEESDVLDTPGLVVELRHERISRIMPDDRGVGRTVVRGGGADVVGGRKGEELLRLGDLAGQCIGCLALALPSEGGCTHTGLARRGSGPGSDEGSGEGGVRACLGR
jgi:hypothetical protein